MDNYLMRAYLRSKSAGMSDSEFIDKMKTVFDSEKYVRGRGVRRNSNPDTFIEDRMYDDFYINRHSDAQLADIMKELNAEDKEKVLKMLLSEDNTGLHFNEECAKYLVSLMYHISGGKKYTGERYDMTRAKEVCERYRGIIPQNTTHADVYVALNTQYHDYCELFKAWFGDTIDSKVIESAISFWFKDDDYKEGSKIYKYFKGA